MATELKEVFERIKENQKKQKDIKNAYRDALMTSADYQTIVEKMHALKEKKKSIENQIKSDFASEFSQIDDIKMDIATDRELMSDIALTTMMKGKTIDLQDEYGNNYEPIFNVKFKKV
jgi:predicted phage-related endonuclease